MSDLFQIRVVGELVHAELGRRFVISLAHLMPLWADVLHAARGRGLRRVLVEGHGPERDMRPHDAYAHGDFLGNLARPGLRVAFCLYGYQPDKLTKHFMNVAAAGSCNVAFFDDLDAAIAWVGI